MMSLFNKSCFPVYNLKSTLHRLDGVSVNDNSPVRISLTPDTVEKSRHGMDYY